MATRVGVDLIDVLYQGKVARNIPESKFKPGNKVIVHEIGKGELVLVRYVQVYQAQNIHNRPRNGIHYTVKLTNGGWAEGYQDELKTDVVAYMKKRKEDG